MPLNRVALFQQCALLGALSSLCSLIGCSSEEKGYAELAPGNTSATDGTTRGTSGNAASGNGNTATSGAAATSNTSGGTTGGINLESNTTGSMESMEPEDLRDSACAGWTAEPERAPAVLQLVVDVSGSMDDPPPGMDTVTKWEITRDALTTALSNLEPTTAAGVLFYPNRDTDGAGNEASEVTECVNTDALIPVDLLGDSGSAQRQLIDQALQTAAPDGLTPTHDAYKYALDNGLLAAAAPGRRFMLLITDGAPTLSQSCIRGEGGGGGGARQVPPEPIIDEVAAAAALDVNTFIIGAPGSEDGSDGEDMRPWLSRAAIEGGTATDGCAEAGPDFCHFDMTQEPDFAVALTEALGDIVGQIASCNYAIPEAPSGMTLDPNLINAIYTPEGGEEQIIGQAADSGACTTGWQLIGDEVVLCPETCTQIQNEPGGHFELLFGCQTLPDVPK